MNDKYEVNRIVERCVDGSKSFPYVICDLKNVENGIKIFLHKIYFKDVHSCFDLAVGDIIFL
jgi:hypothetical protein